MFRHALPLVLTVTMALPVMAQQPLSNEEIALAIKAGEDRRYDHMLSSCNAGPGFSEGLFATGVTPGGYYSVFVSGAAGHIARLAADAKRLYKPFTLASVGPEMTEPVVYLSAVPHSPERSGNKILVASPIESVVLKQKDGAMAIQPRSLQLEPVEWKNLMGATFNGTAASATFALEEFKAIPAGDIDIVLVTAAGERRCKIGKNDRGMLESAGVPTRRR